MPVIDAETTRMVRAQIFRRYIDSSMLDVQVMHGIVYVRGIVRPLRSHGEVDLEHEIEIITHMLRTKPGVRDVVWEAVTRT